MIPLPNFNTDYLKIPKHLLEKIHHEENYIKNGSEKKSVRKIYSKVKFDPFEQEHIVQLQSLIKQHKVIFPQRIIQEDRLLRYLYSAEFEIEKAFKILTGHFEWLSNHDNFKIKPKTLEYLEKGAVYLAGRDKQCRPIIIINVKLLYGSSLELPAFMNALYTVFNICREVIFVPGSIENWILIIETAEMSMMAFPYDVLNNIIKTASLQYSGTMEKIYITNPSLSLNIAWSVIAKFMDVKTLQKINKLKKTEYSKMFACISPDQLEMKYGGTMDNITDFWPPINPYEHIELPINTFEENEENNLMTNSFYEKKDPNRDTKRRIFDDSNLSRSHSPFLKEEIDEIMNHRKTKNAPLTKDLYEEFGRNSNRSMKNSKCLTNGNKSHHNPEDFKSMYKVLSEKKNGIDGHYSNKRESSYCGLCFTERKNNENPEKERTANISVCSIF